jgi:protein phosphatase
LNSLAGLLAVDQNRTPRGRFRTPTVDDSIARRRTPVALLRCISTAVLRAAPDAIAREYRVVNLLAPDQQVPVASLSIRAFGLTDQGRVRTSNEDSFLIAEMARTLWVRQTNLAQPQTQFGRNRAHLFLVADGMGGHNAGEVASALSLESVEAFVLHLLRRFSNLQPADEAGVLKDFQTALRQADARLLDEAAQHPEWKGMGTTMTLAFASGRSLFVVHAGDSRCYLFRDGKLRQLTEDHTVVGELARHGVLDAAQAHRHPFRHVVTNVLGGKDGTLRIDVQRIDLNEADVVLLCSDGLSDMLDDERIRQILATELEPETACARLVAEANEEGGKDNVTTLVARFEKV